MNQKQIIITAVANNPGLTSKELCEKITDIKAKSVIEEISRLKSKGILKASKSTPYTYEVVKSKAAAVLNKKSSSGGEDGKVSDFVKKYIESNPDSTYTEFAEKHGKVCSDGNYYRVRRMVTGVSAPHRSSKTESSVYMTLWSHDAKGVSEESRALLKDFLDTLNRSARSRMEFVELRDPEVIEIRERATR